ncbi:MAG: Crp/Fnr family transcriptional regulator [Gammaproteobacteria bacterium]|nr:Crp/Fnr family transcriptional regulator [Gammaproteobacteria bacterium]MCW8911256.1 Crp/Fnr family transcriptional regulator [Gammaproteobacteria bacterium]MCW9005066.1 Crp/Fnr family transcriptional regulator [Gammaproteobacteria bacterium]
MKASANNLAIIYDMLPEQDQKALFDFAEFLQSRAPEKKTDVLQPVDIPRPEKESVVAAIKRLNKTYPMINRTLVLHETSDFMMQHVVSGKAASEVIDGLENMFNEKFRKMTEEPE